jgi:TolA-binding protein
MSGLLDPEMAEQEVDPLLERAASALAEDARSRPGDAELLATAVAGAMRSAPVTSPRPLRTVRLRTWMLAAAALVALASLASGAIWNASRAKNTAIEAPPPPPEVATLSPPPPPAPPTVSSPEDLPRAAPESPPTPSAPPVAPVDTAEETPAALFAAANEARRRGGPGAPELYQNLQRRFPGSPEARLSQIALGRLYLDKLGDAKGALAQFDAYEAGGGGALLEEALVGRALALGSLGRSADERHAWERLLEAYPDSISADRARRRLTELR